MRYRNICQSDNFGIDEFTILGYYVRNEGDWVNTGLK